MNDQDWKRNRSRYLRKKQSIQKKRFRKYLPKDARNRPDRHMLNQPCGCFSGKRFKDCCYRPDHAKFNLKNYFKPFKTAINSLYRRVSVKVIAEYNRKNKGFRELSDGLSRKLGIPPMPTLLRQAVDAPQNIFFKDDYDSVTTQVAKTLFMHEVTMDRVFSNHEKSLFDEMDKFFMRKHLMGTPQEKIFQAISSSTISIYEVIETRSEPDTNRVGWTLLRDLFDGKTHEFKDPNFKVKPGIWSLAIGRLITFNGFSTFLTYAIFIPPHLVPLVTRVLFITYCLHEIKVNGKSISQLLQQHYSLFQDFTDAYKPLRASGFYVKEVRDYLKNASTDMLLIYTTIQEKCKEEGKNYKSKVEERETLSEGLRVTCNIAIEPDKILDLHDTLLQMDGRLIPHEFIQSEKMFELISGIKTRDHSCQQPSVFNNPKLPSVEEILAQSSVEDAIQAMNKAYSGLHDVLIDEYLNAEHDHLNRPIRIVFEDGLLELTVLDESILPDLQEKCEIAIKKVGIDQVQWDEPISLSRLRQMVYDVMWDLASKELEEFNDETEDTIDLPGINEPLETKMVDNKSNMQCARERKLLAWIDLPSCLLEGNTPAECAVADKMQSRLELLLKVIDRLESDAMVDRDGITCWDVLGFERPA
ncbi:MAG: hypothetical protein ACFFCS_02255 [Candidatus Hodarchaeota archaeon]